MFASRPVAWVRGGGPVRKIVRGVPNSIIVAYAMLFVAAPNNNNVAPNVIIILVAAQGFWLGGTLDRISYMNSSQVLYCNGVAKISVLKGHSTKMDSSKTF